MRLFLLSLSVIAYLSITLLEDVTAAVFVLHPSSNATRASIEMTGQITIGDLFRLQRAFAQATNYESADAVRSRRLYLDSVGGNTQVAMEIGRYLRANHIRTLIAPGSTCYSACAIAFLGGAEQQNGITLANRHKATNGLLGFHVPRPLLSDSRYSADHVGTLINATQQRMYDIVRYFLEVDGDPRILEHIFSTPNDSMYYINNSEALEYCIYVYDDVIETNPFRLNAVNKVLQNSRWLRAPCRNP